MQLIYFVTVDGVVRFRLNLEQYAGWSTEKFVHF